MTTTFSRIFTRLLLTLGVLLTPTVAFATPVLQVYIEGATYNTTTESWEFVSTDGTAEVVILAALDEGETLSDVNLVVSYGSENTDASVSLTSEAGTSISSTGGSGDVPDGLSAHGIYGEGTDYQIFGLGDFVGGLEEIVYNTTDGDGFTTGDVRAYSMTITNVSGTIHLDAFGTNESGKIKFAPYSHDGEIVTSVPELSPAGTAPAAALVLGFMFIVATRRREATV